MARKKLQPVTREDARAIGAMLRGLRRAAGYRAVQDAAAAGGFPAARQTIYAYERGGLTPSLQQFLEIIEFYALHPSRGDGTKRGRPASPGRRLRDPCAHPARLPREAGARADGTDPAAAHRGPASHAPEHVMLTQIDHVGIAVADLEDEVERYRRSFGLEPTHRERMQDQGVEEV